MRQPDQRGPGLRMRGPAARFDSRGVRRGLPYAADPRFDFETDEDAADGADGGLPPAADGDGEPGFEPGADAPGAAYGAPAEEPDDQADAAPDGEPADEPPPSRDAPPWPTADGTLIALPFPIYRPYPLQPRPPRWPRPPRRPPRRRFPRLGRLVRGSRRAGTLRSRRTGARFPVYRGRSGGRSWRIVTRTRPRGRGRREIEEIVALQPELEAFPLGAWSGETEHEAFPLGEGEEEYEAFPLSPARSGGGRGRPSGGYRLRLPHSGVHSILSRLQPERLRDLAGGRLPADPARAVVGAVGRIARRARRARRWRARGGGPVLEVFRAEGYDLLVRPTGPREGEILLLRPSAGEELEGELSLNGVVTWEGPFTFALRGSLFTTKPKTSLGRSGIYLVEKRGNRGWGPIYVGKATSFGERLDTRREVMRELGVSRSHHRVYLGVLSSHTGAAPTLSQLEHAVARTVINAFNPPRGPFKSRASHTAGGGWTQIPPLTNLSPKEPFRVGPGGFSLSHQGDAPAYLTLPRPTREKDEWFEFE